MQRGFEKPIMRLNGDLPVNSACAAHGSDLA
jgi:hypothetical protein